LWVKVWSNLHFSFKRSFRQQDFKLETSTLNFWKIQLFCIKVKKLH
jgi:hypothetical protein